MTIHLETEVVATGFDPTTQTCTYTIERFGQRWTASVPKDDLDRYKGATAKQQRRQHIAKALEDAMRGQPDE